MKQLVVTYPNHLLHSLIKTFLTRLFDPYKNQNVKTPNCRFYGCARHILRFLVPNAVRKKLECINPSPHVKLCFKYLKLLYYLSMCIVSVGVKWRSGAGGSTVWKKQRLYSEMKERKKKVWSEGNRRNKEVALKGELRPFWPLYHFPEGHWVLGED